MTEYAQIADARLRKLGESMRRKKLREDFGEIEAMLKGENQ